MPGHVTAAFDYAGTPFAAGRHRGADFAARPGQPVRSACAGRVMFAGTAGSNGPVVSVRCGAWRVAYLPLRALAVRAGAQLASGALVGTAAGTGRHAGLHVGVRREGSRRGYVDPLRFFGAAGELPLAPAPRPPSGRPRPAAPPASRAAPERRVQAPRPDSLRRPAEAPQPDSLRHRAEAPRRDTLRGRVQAPRPDSLRRPAEAPQPDSLRHPAAVPARGPQRPVPAAPWPAWAGLALVLAGAGGAALGRRRRVAHPRPVATPARE